MTTDSIVHPPAHWVRPTACDIPNPPRKRTTPLRFASNAFHPEGWSPPPSRATSQVNLAELAHDIQVGSPTGAPAVVYAPVVRSVSKAINVPKKRTEPIRFAASSFEPKKWPGPLTPSQSSSTLSTDDGNDEILISPASRSNPLRPPAPLRRRTEPIGFAVNGWRIDVPAISLQVDTRVCSPPASPPNGFDWIPVYAKPPHNDSSLVKPCTKWMARPVASPKGAIPLLPTMIEMPAAEDLGERQQSPISEQLVRANSADAANDSITSRYQPSEGSATRPKPSARSSSHGQMSNWSQYKYRQGPISPRLSAAEQVAHEEAMAEELREFVLEELPVSRLHPQLTFHPRPASPHQPQPPVGGSGPAPSREDTGTPSVLESLQRSAAENKLVEVLSKHQAVTSPKDLLGMGAPPPEIRAEDPGCLAPPTRPDEGETARASLRDLLKVSPHVPPSTPLSDGDILASSPAPEAPKDPFYDWAERQTFNAESVTAKVCKLTSRVVFDDIEGLAVSAAQDDDVAFAAAEDQSGDVDISNVADLGDSSLPFEPVQSRSTRRLSFPW